MQCWQRRFRSKTYHLFGRITDQFHRTLVPYIHLTLVVDTEDGGISSIDQLGVLSLLSNASSDILADTDDTDNVALLIPTGGGVQKNLDTGTGLGHERELEVSRLLAAESSVENGLDGRLEILGNCKWVIMECK